MNSSINEPDQSKSEFFYHLTPDVIIRAVEECGFEPNGYVLTLNSFENRVYDIALEEGNHVVAKFYRPGRWSAEQIREEHQFLLDLQNDEITVCAPIVFNDGTTIKNIEGLHYAIWPRTGGRQEDELSDLDLEILGHLLARIHNTGSAGKMEKRIHLTGEEYVSKSLRFLAEGNWIPERLKDRYIKTSEAICEVYDRLSHDVPVHRIHGDCHLGNLLKGSKGWFFLDFDDSLTGSAVQDLWMLLPARDEEGERKRTHFLDAYRQFRDFNPLWLRLIEPLRGLRYIRYAAWVARRWNDPAFPIAFPHFGTEGYWEEETNDLESLLEHIRETVDCDPLTKKSTDSADKLTNKDFFWDWEGK